MHTESSFFIEHLSVIVTGVPYPNSTEPEDRGLLQVSLTYNSEHSSVDVPDCSISLREFDLFRRLLMDLSEEGEKTISWTIREPEVSLTLTRDVLGSIAGILSITPDHLKEKHEYRLELDQTHLPRIISDLQAIQEKYKAIL